jgi:Nif-specific regulatory protein
LIDSINIGRLLLENGRISKKDYAEALRISKETGKSLPEIFLNSGKVSVDELVQALTIHMDITLLKEALGMEYASKSTNKQLWPLGSYLERISMLFKMGTLISSQTNMSSLIELLIREAPTVMNAERATIFIADHETRELYSHVGVGLTHDQIRIPWESGIAGWVFTHAKSLNIVDPYSDPRFNKQVDPRTGFVTKNLLCVPLRTPGGPVLGVFQVLNKRAGVFTSTDQEILEILASQAARAMEHALEWDNLTQKAFMLSKENVGLKEALHQKDPLDEIVGNTKPVQDVRALIKKVAPTETSVLIQGESGTGKELVARAIHSLSGRGEQAMISLNCAAVPADLIESELFGHRKGAFTGAINDHRGVFRAAHNGTLFLDEIEATSPAMQVKLLRALQVGEIKPVGDNAIQIVNVRLIAATNRELSVQVSLGTFREDLYYRINVFPITIPPLRDRAEDIPVLVRYFLDRLNGQTGKSVRAVDPAAMDLLLRYRWPGNVRELENEVERAHIMTGDGSNISVRCLSPRITQSSPQILEDADSKDPTKLKDAIDKLEKDMILAAMEACEGNKTWAAKRLGLSRQGLINKIGKYGFKEYMSN